MKKAVIISWIITLLTAMLTSCAVSNKTHWNHVHPYGGYAGGKYLKPVMKDSTVIVKK